MRLMAKEDDVYKLMDRRDLYLGGGRTLWNRICCFTSFHLIWVWQLGKSVFSFSSYCWNDFFAVLYMENQPTDYGSGTVLSGTG